MSAPALTPEQRAAVECRDRDVLVEAGAGTGKTSTSINRYARLIEDGLEPSRILVFTFTEKAATELRERVRRMRAAGGAEFSMSAAWIGTFHSICARILRAHPIAAGVDPAFAILEDVPARRLKEAAYEEALSRVVAEPAGLDAVARFNPATLEEGVLGAYEKLRSHGQARPALPPLPPDRGRPRELARELAEAAAAALETPRIRAATKERIEPILAWAAALPPDREPTFEEVRAIDPGRLSDGLKPLRAALDRLLARTAEAAFGDGVRAALGELLAAYGEAYAERKAAAGALDFEDLQLAALELLRDHPAVAAEYRDQFGEIMVDEFQDTNPLQMELIAALRGPDTTLFTVGDEMQAIYGFRHADVELFRARRDDPAVTVLPLSANFRSTAPVIGAVNAIGARVTDGVGAHRSDGATGRDAAGTSHRFQPLRVGAGGATAGDAVELVMTEAGAWKDLDLGDLSPAPDPDDEGAAERADAVGQHEAEALDLAHRVRDAIERDGFRPGEIVLLFRTKSRMWMFERALQQVGVPSYVVGGSGFWETREGVDLRSLLAVLANPLDDDALLGVLAGPAGGLSTDAIWMLAAARGRDRARARQEGRPRGDGPDRPEPLPLWTVLAELDASGAALGAEDRARAERIVRVISGLRARAATTPLGELVEAAVTETGYDLVAVLRDPSGAGLANVRRVATLAAGYEAAEGRDLRGLVEWIDASRELDAESAVATEDERSDVVRLLTIHKSKGLEFGLVCVADLGRKRKPDSESVLWIGRDPDRPGELALGMRVPDPDGPGNLDLYAWPDLQRRTNLDSADEELRLLHVALTRAERRLVLSGVERLDRPPRLSETCSAMSRIACAFDLVGDDAPEAIPVPAPEALAGAGPAPAGSTIRVARNLASTERAAELRAGGALPAPGGAAGAAAEPPLARPAPPSRPDVPLSYSAMAAYAECPARFYAGSVLRLEDPGRPSDPGREAPLEPGPVRPRGEGTRFGNAVHALLERLPARRWILPTENEIAAALAEREAAADPGAVERAREMIAGFTGSELGRRVAAGRADVEAQLLIRLGGVTIRGFADLLLRDAAPPLILDYKSNRLDGDAPESRMDAYRLQRDLYALGVARATGSEAVETAFVFLEAPDRPVLDVFDGERLTAAAGRIEALVGEIVRGSYLGGPDALHQPCRRCWACDLLASRLTPSPDPDLRAGQSA